MSPIAKYVENVAAVPILDHGPTESPGSGAELETVWKLSGTTLKPAPERRNWWNAGVRLDLLGEPRVFRDDGTEVPLREAAKSQKAKIFIAMVAYQQRPVAHDDLRAAMWADDPDPRSTSHVLHDYSSDTREALGIQGWKPDPLRSTHEGYELRVESETIDDDSGVVTTDIADFQDKIRRSKLGQDKALARQALGLVRGNYLDGTSAAGIGWLERTRKTIGGQCSSAAHLATKQPLESCAEAVRQFFENPDGTLLDFIERKWPADDALTSQASADPLSSSDSPSQTLASPEETTDPTSPEPTRLEEPSTSAESTPATPVSRRLEINLPQIPEKELLRLMKWAILVLLVSLPALVVMYKVVLPAYNEWLAGKAKLGASATSQTPSENPAHPGGALVANEPPAGDPVTPTDELSTNALWLAAGLKVANRSYDNEWTSTEVRADPTDQLRFALTVSNTHGADPARMTAFLDEEQMRSNDAPDARRLRVVIGDDVGKAIARTNWVTILPWTSQGSTFSIGDLNGNDSVDVANTDKPDTIVATRRVNDTVRLPPELQDQVGAPSFTNLGPIPKDEQLFFFDGSLGLRVQDGFGGYPPEFRRLEPERSEWMNKGSVTPGDLIEIWMLLDNQGNHTGDASIYLRSQRSQQGRVVKLQASVRMFDRTSHIGSFTLNSQTGQPISVLPRPGTTVFEAPDPAKVSNCEPERLERTLEDGIMLGGIDIGPFGGFTPQASCAGEEYNGRLRLEAVIGN